MAETTPPEDPAASPREKWAPRFREKDGRWRSERGPEQEAQNLEEEWKALPDADRRLVMKAMRKIHKDGRSKEIEIASRLEYERPLVGVEKFYTDPYYIGDFAKKIYPSRVKDLIEIFEGGYHEVIMSGCIDQNAIVSCADGSMPRLGALIGRRTDVTTVDAERGVESHATTPGLDSGVKKVLRLTLRNGMRTRLTPEHKVLTDRGWIEARHLDVENDRVLVPRKITYRPSCFSLKDEEVKLLAYWQTDGSCDRYRARFGDGRIETSLEVIASLRALGFDATGDPVQRNGQWEISVKQFIKSGFKQWMASRGIFQLGDKTATVEVPDAICRAPLKQVALFLNRIWAAEGTVFYKPSSPPRFQLGMKSEHFMRQVQLLLLRFGVQGRLGETRGRRHGKRWKVWTLQVTGKDNIERFHAAIGPIYAKERETELLMARVAATEGNTNVDVVPLTWGEASRFLTDNGIVREAGSEWWRLSTNHDCQLSRTMFDNLCTDFGAHPAVAALAERYPESVAYERIKAVIHLKRPIPVADIGVPGPQRFTANGIAVHNSIGYGKSTTGVLIMMRMIYEAVNLTDPQLSYGVPAGTQIHFVNFSIKVELARKVLFENIGEKLHSSQYFKEVGFTMTKDEIRFPKGITIAAGTSTAAGALGLNTFGAIMDETDFYGDVRGGMKKDRVGGQVKDRAETIYTNIIRRMKSRFMEAGKLPGLLVILSSKRESSDFTERRLKHARETNDPKVFYREYALWDMAREKFSKQTFNVLVGNEVTQSRIMAPGEEALGIPEGTRIVQVPADFKDDFTRDVDGAIRDLAGISTVAVAPFIPMRERLSKMVDGAFQHPFASEQWTPGTPLRFDQTKLMSQDDKGHWRPICCPEQPRHTHIDASLNKLPTGFCIAHVCGMKEVPRREEVVEGVVPVVIIQEVPRIRADILLQILPPKGEEIVLAEVCALVTLFRRRGIPIVSVSMDQYQSQMPLQVLEGEGFETSRISVENPQPYLTLKEAIYEERVLVYQFEVVLNELRQLEWNHVKFKVEKPSTGTKDVADSLAACVYHLTKEAPRGVVPPPSLGISVRNEAPGDAGASYVPGGSILWNDETPPFPDDGSGNGNGDNEAGEFTVPFFMG